MMQKTITHTRDGSITISAKLRQAFGIQQNDPIIADLTPEGILLRPSMRVAIEFD